MVRLIGTTAAAARGHDCVRAGTGVDVSKAKLRTPAALTEQAPPTYKAKFETSKGNFVVEVHRDWAPKGADRFYNLVKNGFFDDGRFFRVVPDFMVQFGINGDPAIQKNWANANIQDDPGKQTNKKGYITFATRGPNADQPGLYQFEGQRVPRQAGVLAVRRSGDGHGHRREDHEPVRREAEPGDDSV